MKRLSLVVLVVALATGVLGQVSLKSTAPPTGGGGGGGIAFDSASSNPTPAVGPITWSHAVVGTSNTVLIVATNGANSGNHSTCTFNGVSMNEVTHYAYPAFYDITVLQLTGVSGTHDIQCNNASGQQIGAGAVAFTGVNQSTPVRGFDGATNTTGGSSITINSAVGDVVVDVVMALTNSGVVNAGDGQTKETNYGWDSGSPNNIAGQSFKDGASPTVTMTWSWTPGIDSWGTVALSLQPQ